VDIFMKIIAVEPESPLFGKIRTGFDLVSINGEPVEDNLDCMYKLAADFVNLELLDMQGKTVRLRLPNDSFGNLGLRFESDKMKICRNKCIFCFVHQQPKGMRHALYVRDDDYRLSFTHGNFITLSNLSESDISRIAEQRLTPLYVSVHATNDSLRRDMFGNKKLPPVLPQLESLTKHKIIIHAQVVLCPGINDGAHFLKTVNDLSSLFPGVASLGVVPVGLTKYRRGLPLLKHYGQDGADRVIATVHSFQKQFLSKIKLRFIYAADEFYIQAGRKLPGLFEYEEMPQFENGVGMMRYFLTDFNRKKRFLGVGKTKKRMAVITGSSAHKMLKNEVITYLNSEAGLNIDLFPVENRFWGRYVTVSGLLTGGDILSCLNRIKGKYDVILLPPNCINDDNLFLDDMSLDGLRKKSGMHISIGSYSMVDTIREALN
jgi:putative radical SAM enzyme (TIGR03279 family)